MDTVFATREDGAPVLVRVPSPEPKASHLRVVRRNEMPPDYDLDPPADDGDIALATLREAVWIAVTTPTAQLLWWFLGATAVVCSVVWVAS